MQRDHFPISSHPSNNTKKVLLLAQHPQPFPNPRGFSARSGSSSSSPLCFQFVAAANLLSVSTQAQLGCYAP